LFDIHGHFDDVLQFIAMRRRFTFTHLIRNESDQLTAIHDALADLECTCCDCSHYIAIALRSHLTLLLSSLRICRAVA
jgi:hypothetical protein